MEKAKRLRDHIDHEHERPHRTKQRTQGCLAQSHFYELMSFDTVHTSIACDR